MLLAKPQRWRDPAWPGRATGVVVFLLVLLPAGYLTEFNPEVFFDATSLRASKQFLATFFPPAHSLAFMQLLVRSAWKTVAIATSGLVLALILAIPLSLLEIGRAHV